MLIGIGIAVVIALIVADCLLDRLMIRAVFALIDRLPPYRPGKRYKSRSMPEKYAAFRKPRNDR